MRDAVVLEARGIPTVILINDVFAPIADATAALLELSPDYVRENVVWLPHPTSNLTRERAAALIDERVDAIRAALLGRSTGSVAPPDAAQAREPLDVARETVAGFAASLREDGAELELLTFENGQLHGELHLSDAAGCEGGACLMPAAQLEQMLAAMIRVKIPSLHSVLLQEVRPNDS